jgi:hypothetical protein
MASNATARIREYEIGFLIIVVGVMGALLHAYLATDTPLRITFHDKIRL